MMLEQLTARWRALPSEQRAAVLIGVPAAGGLALWARYRTPATDEAAPVADETATIAGGAGAADSGMFGQLTDAWNAALGQVTGRVEDVEAEAAAATAATGSQAARLAAQRARLAAQQERLRKQQERLKKNAARDARQAAALKKLRDRLARQRANKRRKQAKAAGGPDALGPAAYAPGLVAAGGALGALGSPYTAAPAGAVPQAAYIPGRPRRAGAQSARRY